MPDRPAAGKLPRRHSSARSGNRPGRCQRSRIAEPDRRRPSCFSNTPTPLPGNRKSLGEGGPAAPAGPSPWNGAGCIQRGSQLHIWPATSEDVVETVSRRTCRLRLRRDRSRRTSGHRRISACTPDWPCRATRPTCPTVPCCSLDCQAIRSRCGLRSVSRRPSCVPLLHGSHDLDCRMPFFLMVPRHGQSSA